MSKRFWWIVGGIGLCLAVAGAAALRRTATPELPVVDASAERLAAKYDAPAGLCPWRDPEGDMKRFFPTATEHKEELLVLSRERLELERRLGRKPTGEENGLRIQRIASASGLLGVIVAQRVKGESGVIELVLAVGKDGKVVGAKLQRLRETDTVTKFLRSTKFLGAFAGKSARSDWQADRDFPALPEKARLSAQALLDGARTILIQLSVGKVS